MILTEREVRAESSVAGTGPTSRRSVKPRFDLLSPPVLMGMSYIGLFAMSVIDIVTTTDGRFRLRNEFRLYSGLSIPALLYLVGGYLLFVSGYYVRAGKLIVKLFPIRSGHLRPSRIPILTVALFCFTFTILVVYTYVVGYGRRVVTSDSGTGSFLDNLVLLGEMSLIPSPWALTIIGSPGNTRPNEREHPDWNLADRESARRFHFSSGELCCPCNSDWESGPERAPE